MDTLFKRPLVPQSGLEPSSSDGGGGGSATTMDTNPFSSGHDIALPYSTASASSWSFGHDIALPYSTASANSWSFSGGGDTGRTIHPFRSGIDLSRLAPAISLADLCDEYFFQPAQRHPFPATGGSDGDNNPFDADVTASLAMEVPVPAPWDRCYCCYDDDDDDDHVHPGVEEPAMCHGGGTLSDDNSTRVLPKLCCIYDGYDEDIEATLRAQEDAAKPSPDYLETTQGGRMSQDTRATLVGWMKLFAQCYDLAPGTLHRAVSYADRFLSVRPLADVGMHRLRVLGAVAVYAAAKYEDQGTVEKLNAAEIANYGHSARGAGFALRKEEVLDMERALLVALDYRLGGPTAYTFVEHFTSHYGPEEVRLLRSCAHDFADMSLLHYGCLRHSPSAVAAAAMFLARLTLKPTYGEMKRWNRELKELTGYEPQELERCVGAIHSLIPHHGDGSYDEVDLFPMLYAIADADDP